MLLYRVLSYSPKPQRQVTASHKSNLLRKFDFPLKSGFHVITFFTPFGDSIPNKHDNYFQEITK